MVVRTSMHDLSTVPLISVPPPVTRQLAAWAHAAEAEQRLGAVVMALPLASATHGRLGLARTVPVAVTSKLAPAGQVTSASQTNGPALSPALMLTVVGIGFPSISVVHG